MIRPLKIKKFTCPEKIENMEEFVRQVTVINAKMTNAQNYSKNGNKRAKKLN